MTRRLFSRAAHRADQILFAIADKFNGNAARRRAIKQRLHLAMMAAERYQLVAARARQHCHAKGNHLLHWRTEFHRNAV